jgi:hypothetical protein
MLKFPTPSDLKSSLNATKFLVQLTASDICPVTLFISFSFLFWHSAFIISRVAESWALQTAHSRELHILSSASNLGNVHFLSFPQIFGLVFCIALDVFCFWNSGTSSVTALATTLTLVCGIAYHMPRVLFFLHNSSCQAHAFT